MKDFVLANWDTIWAQDAAVGERIRGVVFILLVVSLLAFLLGGVADRAKHVPPPPPPDGSNEKLTWLAFRAATARFLRAALAPFSPLSEYLPITAGAWVIFSLLLALLALDRELRWAAAAASVPAFLVLLQYVYLWVHTPTVRQGEASTDTIRDPKFLEERARRAVNSAYGPRTLFIRYGFPAIVLLVEGLVLVFALVRPSSFLTLRSWELVYGAQFGAIGAYSWVILELGRRSFRRDVTSGIAVWSIVALAVGPMLAAVIALLWRPAPRSDTAWQLATVYFFTGYAPRTVLGAVSSAGMQLLRIGPAPSIEARTTPLTKLRGINPQIAERLAEEGIDNVETLATVEPIRLHRDTSFDLGTILWWVDEALLLMYVPQRWALLEEQGITGAIDLADLATSSKGATQAGVAAPPTTNPWDAVIDSLAQRVNMSRPEFEVLIERVSMDRHVNYIWWMYNVHVSNGARGA